MRKVSAIAMGLLVLAGISTTGGCVGKDKYDELWAMNRKAQDALTAANDKARLLENENQKLKGELADRDATIRAQLAEIDGLKATNQQLADALAKARADLASRGDIKPLPLGPLPSGLNKALEDLAKNNSDIFEFDKANGMVKFKADMTFDKGSIEIKADAKAALKKLAEILNSPEAREFNIYVAGHTDDIRLANPETIRKYESNWGLSTFRAVAVVSALFEGGINQVRMGAMGFSKYHPVEPNLAGGKGNVANRRVEIWIVPQTLLLTGSSVKADGTSAENGHATAGKAGRNAEPKAVPEEN